MISSEQNQLDTLVTTKWLGQYLDLLDETGRFRPHNALVAMHDGDRSFRERQVFAGLLPAPKGERGSNSQKGDIK